MSGRTKSDRLMQGVFGHNVSKGTLREQSEGLEISGPSLTD
jgi:hypothetical protein